MEIYVSLSIGKIISAIFSICVLYY